MTIELCQTSDSGWRPTGASYPVDFHTSGKDLAVELREWRDGETLDVAPSTGDELGAVLNGRFELVCGDERHVLEAGGGILIPRGEAHQWRLLSERGTLYRVTAVLPAA
jgi:mannose-6-phosphate isomerase-like protein (cupin superfamily)